QCRYDKTLRDKLNMYSPITGQISKNNNNNDAKEPKDTVLNTSNESNDKLQNSPGESCIDSIYANSNNQAEINNDKESASNSTLMDDASNAIHEPANTRNPLAMLSQWDAKDKLRLKS
ncbi:hypothetical protein, partial [Salmonella sp. s51228]|uniref:hypothetical protein n=1 Tax=Salmonella sp. s51228 TaxID=3159652 RepID=UPI00397F9D6C